MENDIYEQQAWMTFVLRTIDEVQRMVVVLNERRREFKLYSAPLGWRVEFQVTPHEVLEDWIEMVRNVKK
jgi:hypothetical protein